MGARAVHPMSQMRSNDDGHPLCQRPTVDQTVHQLSCENANPTARVGQKGDLSGPIHVQHDLQRQE